MNPTIVATRSPIDGQVVGEVALTPVDQMDEVFARARTVQPAWAARSVAQRQRVLLRYHDLVMRHREEILDLIVAESGKARKDAFQELIHVAMTARYYGLRSGRYLADQRRLGALPALTRVNVYQAPCGVVGVISPWNYPFTMVISDGLAAIAAGNAVVAKPDAQAVLTASYAVELLREAGLPADLWQVVAGAGDVIGTAIVERADYVCFTGSTAVGRLIGQQCGERLVSCSLELGGKNPMLVLDDADVAKAAAGAVRGAFSNAGQLCVSIERIIVADEVYDAFRSELVERVRRLRIGDPRSWTTDVGSLISREQRDRVAAHVADAVSQGAQVVVGGEALPEHGPFFFAPTVLEAVTPSMRVR